MNILNVIMSAGGGAAVRQLGSQFGLDEAQTASTCRRWFLRSRRASSAISGGLRGLASLVSALSGGQHQRYFEDPSALVGDAPVSEGNGILGHILGGDTLSKIAKEQLGNAGAFMKIFELNKDQLSDPDKIRPGQVLRLP